MFHRTLDWVPEHDELDRIVAHALYWEEQLNCMQTAS
jgi:hypothetical protein